jgi:hypothetical protein
LHPITGISGKKNCYLLSFFFYFSHKNSNLFATKLKMPTIRKHEVYQARN